MNYAEAEVKRYIIFTNEHYYQDKLDTPNRNPISHFMI